MPLDSDYGRKTSKTIVQRHKQKRFAGGFSVDRQKHISDLHADDTGQIDNKYKMCSEHSTIYANKNYV